MPETPQASPEATSAPWWQPFYHDLGAALIAEMILVRHDPEEMDATVGFLTERLKIRPGDAVLDQCCGIGNVVLALAARGCRALGVDQSAPYIARAQHDAAEQGIDAHFDCGDAFVWRAPEPCDAAFNWYSSFGYAPTDAQNIEMLRRAFESLKPGGRFALDVPNMPGLIRAFQPVMLRRRVLPTAQGEALLMRESRLDLTDGGLHQVWTWILPDGRRDVSRSRLQLYFPHQIAGMLRQCGFEDVEFWGGVRGEPLDLNTLRCVLTARKPE